LLAVTVAASACTARERQPALISEKTTMVTAWQVPQNPLNDPALTDSRLADQIKWGFRIFTDTPHEAPRFTGAKVSCSNCHLNAGQRERALPVVGVAGMFPEYNARAARLISLNDRIVDCFLRSENATGQLERESPGPTSDGATRQTAHGAESADERQLELPTPTSKEVLAVAAYLAWLSKGHAVGQNPPWRGRNAIASDHLVPVDTLDRSRGEAIYRERCTSCHGQDGQGVQIGDKKAGPLWGADSWNDGAGASRVYTLAGIIRYAMPYLDPGSLTDEDAQHVAAFITSQPRPVYPFKDRDYPGGKVPADAVYYVAAER
jgi:thiosulfate dehydrogenase